MNEYKGYGGWKINIDGDNIFIKQMFIKENCTFDDVTLITKEAPTALKNGAIRIKTKKQYIVPHQLSFLKKNEEQMNELYDLLIEKAPHASPENILKDAMASDDIKEEGAFGLKLPKFCPECGTNVEGMKFCPECGNQTQSSAYKSSESMKQQISQNNIARCPKCGSASLTANKKGFGIGKAVVGAALTGGIGLAAGNIGAKKVRITCLNCGKQWMA